MKRLFFMIGLAAPLLAQDTTTVQREVLAADRRAAESLAALNQLRARDAVLLVDNAPIAVSRADWDRFVAKVAGGETPAWIPIHAVVSPDGLFACSTGVLRRRAADSTQASTGRYAHCWRKRGAEWQLLVMSHALAPASIRSLPEVLAMAPSSTGAVLANGGVPAMIAADRAFAGYSADSGGPANAFAKWIAADGMMLGARAVPTRGSVQARAAFAGFPASGKFLWGPRAELTQSSDDGSLGFTIGEATIAATPTDLSYSKYLTIWRREADGSYKFIFDIGSARPAP